MQTKITKEQLGKLLARFDSGLACTSFRRLSGGASQESWLITAQRGDTPLEVVLRRGQNGAENTRDTTISLQSESELITLAHANGIAVPKILHVLDTQDKLGSGYLMECVYGETIARKIFRDEKLAKARQILARQCGETIADISRIDTTSGPPLEICYGRDRWHEITEQYTRLGECRPIMEYALRWLDERMPPDPVKPRLVHGDFRNGNLMIDENGIAAVLDWELAHLGDPIEDLGWLCVPSWRFGATANPAGGFGSVADLIAGFEAHGGGAVDPEALKFWTVIGTLYWGLCCIQFAADFRAGDRTVERASIGRRCSETEMDLMLLTRSKGLDLS